MIIRDMGVMEIKLFRDVPMLKFPAGRYEFSDFNGRTKEAEISKDLWIDLIKVNFIQFFNFVKSGAYFCDRYLMNLRGGIDTANKLLIEMGCDPWNPDLPIKVTGEEAEAFARWLNKRLLTEEEWEVFAAYTVRRLRYIDNRNELLLLNARRANLEDKNHPMHSPAEWCTDRVGNKLVKGHIDQAFPLITDTFRNTSSRLFSVRCCKEEE